VISAEQARTRFAEEQARRRERAPLPDPNAAEIVAPSEFGAPIDSVGRRHRRRTDDAGLTTLATCCVATASLAVRTVLTAILR
jgi:hypothetical protein